MNYVRVLEQGVLLLNKLPPSQRFFKEIHRTLLTGVRGKAQAPGQFRKLQYHIGASTDIDQARFIPPPAHELSKCLTELERYINNDTSDHPLVKLAFVHYQFETIHPFNDGNGRLGRLLITLLLIHWGVLDFPVLHLSDYLEQNRAGYYDILLSVSQVSTWRDWLLYFLDGVAWQAGDTIQRLKRLFELNKNWHEILVADKAPANAFALLDMVIRRPYLWPTLVRDELKVSYGTARNALQRLVALGVLRELNDDSGGVIYYARDLISIIRETEE